MVRRAVLLALTAFAPASAGHAPARIVSLSPCLDATLARIAPTRLQAVSHWSHDPGSTQMDVAVMRRWPATHGSAEEVIRLRPALVVAGTHIDPATLNAMRRAGLRIELFDVPQDVPAAIAEVERLGQLAGAWPQAAALTSAMRAAVRRRETSPSGGEILLRGGEGLTPGAATLPGDVVARLGLVNAAARYGVTGWGAVGLEALALNPPKLLLSTLGRSDRALTHPVLARLERGGMRRASFDGKLMNCGGAAVIGLAEALIRAEGEAR